MSRTNQTELKPYTFPSGAQIMLTHCMDKKDNYIGSSLSVFYIEYREAERRIMKNAKERLPELKTIFEEIK